MKRIGALLQGLLPKGLRSSLGRRAVERARRRRARKLASYSKRLDLCAAQMAHVLHLAGLAGTHPLRGARCLELGAGWVLSHAVVMHLLGARKVIATDVAPNACPRVLRHAVREARPSNVRDLLAPFDDHSLVRQRLDALLAVGDFSLEALAALGIDYVAPIDLARRGLDSGSDWAFSFSVLEHVPVDDVQALMAGLAAELAHGGRMIHCVHLEDHDGPRKAPFAFLAEPAHSFTRRAQTDRGNRIRWSQWQQILADVPDVQFRCLYRWSRRDRPLPDTIDPAVRHVDEADLRVSHFGVLGTKADATP